MGRAGIQIRLILSDRGTMVAMTPSVCILFRGGAAGAESAFGACAERRRYTEGPTIRKVLQMRNKPLCVVETRSFAG
jgi:hypothetical protein